MSDALGLTLMLFAAAVLYTSVGHAGASGYLAAMALYGLAPADMRAAALALNVLAAALTTLRFITAGCFDRRLFWPLAAGSVPAAFLGGWLTIPGPIYRPILSAALALAALHLAWPRRLSPQHSRPMLPIVGLACGSAIGLFSGLTGVGGGVFLTPLLLTTGWTDIRTAAGVSAAFILLNSIAALSGRLLDDPTLPPQTPSWAFAVFLGTLIGSSLGSRVFGPGVLRPILGLILLIAAAKLVLG